MTMTHPIRIAQALILATIVAALVAPTLALGNPTTTSPRKGTLATSRASDWFERGVAIHARRVLTDGHSPDTVDAAAATQPRVADGRAPGSLDAAHATRPIQTVQPGGFGWGDAGIAAIVAALAILSIGGTTLLVARFHRRQRVQAT